MKLKNPIWEHRYLHYFASRGWIELLKKVRDDVDNGKLILPDAYNVFRAFDDVPPHLVRVVILGQDPYPDARYATGLAFSVPMGTNPLPGSLKNIFRAIKTDLRINNTNGNLNWWSQQGVLLLNSVLTVEKDMPDSHSKYGWQNFTDEVIMDLGSTLEVPKVFMLWGKKAQVKKKYIDTKRHLVLEAPHPSPLSAHKGFIWCKHFSQANKFLTDRGRATIDWRT